MEGLGVTHDVLNSLDTKEPCNDNGGSCCRQPCTDAFEKCGVQCSRIGQLASAEPHDKCVRGQGDHKKECHYQLHTSS